MVSVLVPATLNAQKNPKNAKFGHFLGRYFSRYNFLIKISYGRASKLIHCLYKRIKAIGNKAMVSALAPATLCAPKDLKFAKFGHFGPLFQPLQLLDQKFLWSCI